MISCATVDACFCPPVPQATVLDSLAEGFQAVLLTDAGQSALTGHCSLKRLPLLMGVSLTMGLCGVSPWPVGWWLALLLQLNAFLLLVPFLVCTAVAGVDESASREAVGEMQRAGAVLLRGAELLEQSRAGGAAAEGSSKAAAAAGAARQQQIAAGKEE